VFRRCGRLLEPRTCVVSENSLAVACLCSLWTNDNNKSDTSQTQDFLAVEAKWNAVCLGPRPSPPLGLWPRWTVIKQGRAESTLHLSSAFAFTLFLFMWPSSWGFFLLFLTGDLNHMSVLFSSIHLYTGARKCGFGAEVFSNCELLFSQAGTRELRGWGCTLDKKVISVHARGLTEVSRCYLALAPIKAGSWRRDGRATRTRIAPLRWVITQLIKNADRGCTSF